MPPSFRRRIRTRSAFRSGISGARPTRSASECPRSVFSGLTLADGCSGRAGRCECSKPDPTSVVGFDPARCPVVWSRRPGPHLVQARGATALPPGADLYPSVARTATSMPVWMGGVTKAVAVYVVNWGQEAFTTPTRLVPAPATTSSALPTWRERLLYIGTPRQSAPSHRRVPGRFPRRGSLSIRGGRR